MKNRFAAAVFTLALPAFAQKAGEVFPAWTPGTLDIHHISTGRGNATLFVMPDGTTMLLDAGASSGANPRWAPARPDASRTPGDWLARYVERMGGAGWTMRCSRISTPTTWGR
ncbi:MAG: hypothetical protein Q8N47_02120 [Bryobacterales bacterium]|nr:hypothetical protein [Bryobacterales bacterium]